MAARPLGPRAQGFAARSGPIGPKVRVRVRVSPNPNPNPNTLTLTLTP